MPAPVDCNLCSRSETRDRVVNPPLREAKYLVVVDAPIKGDEVRGRFATGSTGDVLRQALRDAGISETDVVVTGATRCTMDKAPLKAHIDACRPFLMQDIAAVKPEVIITMGQGSLASVLKLKGVKAQRGSIWDDNAIGVPVVPTYSLGVVYRNYKDLEFIASDLRKAKDAANGVVTEPDHTIVGITRTVDEVREVRDYLLAANEFSFDIESTGLNPLADNAQVLCFSFSAKAGYGYTVPLVGYMGRDFWSPADYEVVFGYLCEILSSPVPKIASNGKFDVRYIETTLGIPVNGFAFDCQLAYAMIHEEWPHDLEHMRTLFTQMKRYDMFKDDEEAKKTVAEWGYAGYPEEELWVYAAHDADVEYRVAQKLGPLVAAEAKGAGGPFSRW